MRRAHCQQDYHARGDDQPLAQIQKAQTELTADRAVFVIGQSLVEPIDLVIFIAKEFHGFIVQQAVNSFCAGRAVRFVHLTPKLDPPLGNRNRIVNIANNCDKGHQGVRPAKIQKQKQTDD